MYLCFKYFEMKKYIFLACISWLFIACEKKNKTDNILAKKEAATVNESDIVIEEILEECYMRVNGKDTLFLKMSDNLGTITGTMNYKNFQKDSSSGDIVGIADGDTIRIDYNFAAEGTQSTREIWFLKKDGKLIEGIGEYDETGERFKNNSVKFTDGQILQPTDCKEFDKK